MSNEKQILQYLSMAVLLFSLLAVALKIFIFQGPVSLPASIAALPKVEIAWDALREQIEVGLPDFEVDIISTPQQVIASSSVTLTVTVKGSAVGPFKYRFDCQNDGVMDFETDFLAQKTFSLSSACFFDEGKQTFKAEVLSQTNYYDNFQAKQEPLSKIALLDLDVAPSNNPPIVAWCDVFPTKGTTEILSPFSFSVDAADPDNDPIFYLWDFGDSATSSLQNPKHSYKAAGFYLPKVAVFDDKGHTSYCIAKSLLSLGDFVDFATMEMGEPKAGRINPFAPTNPAEYTLPSPATTPTTTTSPIIP